MRAKRGTALPGKHEGRRLYPAHKPLHFALLALLPTGQRPVLQRDYLQHGEASSITVWASGQCMVA